MKNLVAVILAAGAGRRFWPLSRKAFFPFLGKPFLEHAVASSLPKEVTRAVIVASPENQEALTRLKLIAPHTVVIQQEPKGMADALLTAQSEIQDVSLLVLNADDISDPNVGNGVVHEASTVNAFGVIPGWIPHAYQDMGYLALSNGNVQKIVEKPGAGRQPSQYVFMVSYFVRDSNVLLDALKNSKSSKDDQHEAALSSLMGDHQFELFEHNGSFASLKYPWHVLSVMELLLKDLTSYKGTNVVIRENVVLQGEVWIGDNVKIYENTKIIGPTYIGSDTIIGNNNLIRESHIGNNCVTGFNTDISRSYVGGDCWFHSNYIGDSVLEGNISLGSGTVLANLRLDEGEIYSIVDGQKIPTGRLKLGAMIGHSVRIGVNTSVMPGIKIGSQSLVGAGIILDQDVANRSFCMGKTQYVVAKNTRPPTLDTRESIKKNL